MAPVRLDVAAVDRALPGGGLPRAALHEVVATGAGAGTAFAAWLAARRASPDGLVLWCGEAAPYAPGLAALGLPPDRLVVLCGRRPVDLLWAMEEGLKSGRPAAVVARLRQLDLTASRRLQLAAEAGGAMAIALRPPGSRRESTAATTRWRVSSAASGPVEGYAGVGCPRWRVTLERCRGGRPGDWVLEWDDATGIVAVAAALADRPAVPGSAAAWA